MSASQQKLPRLPKGSKVQKRPLTRPQQPSTSTSRLIYLSSSTPFMSAVKRVRKRLDRAASGSSGPPGKKVPLSAKIDALKKGGTAGEDGTEVVVLGTGKAIEKVMGVASWFEDERDCKVEVRTRTVGTVDDVVVEGEGAVEDESRVRKLSCLEATIRLR